MYHMKYFTIKNSFFLVPSTKCNEEFEKIDKFLKILEKSGVGKLINSIHQLNKTSLVGRKGCNPFNMFALIVYCFSKYKSSLREIEQLCLFNLRVIYIMEQKTPSYKVICEFINKYIVPYQYEIFAMITKTIIEELSLDISYQYLDGTKIEANANKYKFVWKPTTYHKKLDTKVKNYLLELGYKEFSNKKDTIKAYELNLVIKDYASNNNIPTGRGTKKIKNKRIIN